MVLLKKNLRFAVCLVLLTINTCLCDYLDGALRTRREPSNTFPSNSYLMRMKPHYKHNRLLYFLAKPVADVETSTPSADLRALLKLQPLKSVVSERSASAKHQDSSLVPPSVLPSSESVPTSNWYLGRKK